jgi:hypothetical protein
MYAFVNLAKNQMHRRGLILIESLANDVNEVVEKAYETAKPLRNQSKSCAVSVSPKPNSNCERFEEICQSKRI